MNETAGADETATFGSGSADTDKLGRAIADGVLRDLAREMVLRGEIVPESVTAEELKSLAQDRLRKIVESGNYDVALVVDHSESILADARRYADERKVEYAFVFYGLYIEHTLNRAIRDRAFQLNFSEKETIEIMRKPIPDKIGVTWTLLFGSRLPDSLRKDIRSVTERRNSFIHYKWQPDPTADMLPGDLKRKESMAFDAAERASVELTRRVNQLVALEGSDIDGWLHSPTSPEKDK
jgi:hypothetical protein